MTSSKSKLPAFFIQARLSSTRYPQKVIRPIVGDRSILDLLIERIRYNFPSHRLYVVTTEDSSDDLIVDKLERQGIDFFRGSVDNVLNRFVAAAEFYDESDIIRVCADNPFIVPDFLRHILDDQDGQDYLSFSFNQVPIMKCHFGFFAERVTRNALQRIATLTIKPVYLEHVTNYLYENPQLFSVKLIELGSDLARIAPYRLTVDTPGDFDTASGILSKIEDLNRISLDDIVRIVEKDPILLQSMNNEIMSNTK